MQMQNPRIRDGEDLEITVRCTQEISKYVSTLAPIARELDLSLATTSLSFRSQIS